MSRQPLQLWLNMPPEAQQRLQEAAVDRSLKKNETIYYEGDEPKGIYFIRHGIIGLVNVSTQGKEHLLRIFKTEQYFGHRTLLAGDRYHASAMALEPAEVTFLPKDVFWEMVDQYPYACRHLMGQLARELRRAELRLASSFEKQVTARVAETVLYLKEVYPEHRWTRNEIAFFCGSTGPTVIRTLANLEEQGLIVQKGRDIAILDREGLEAFAGLEE